MTEEMLENLMRELKVWIQDDELNVFVIHLPNKEIVLMKEVLVDIDPSQKVLDFGSSVN